MSKLRCLIPSIQTLFTSRSSAGANRLPYTSKAQIKALSIMSKIVPHMQRSWIAKGRGVSIVLVSGSNTRPCYRCSRLPGKPGKQPRENDEPSSNLRNSKVNRSEGMQNLRRAVSTRRRRLTHYHGLDGSVGIRKQ